MAEPPTFIIGPPGLDVCNGQADRTSVQSPLTTIRPDCLVIGVLKTNWDGLELHHAYKLREFPGGFNRNLLNSSGGLFGDLLNKTGSARGTSPLSNTTPEHLSCPLLPGNLQPTANMTSLGNGSDESATPKADPLKDKDDLPKKRIHLSFKESHSNAEDGSQVGDSTKLMQNHPEKISAFKEATRPPPSVFPEPYPTPTGLPVRLPPHTPEIQALDDVYNQKEHPTLDSIVDEAVDEMTSLILQQKISDRVPYAQLASSRLQAIMGLRNDYQFELPQTPSVAPPEELEGKKSCLVENTKGVQSSDEFKSPCPVKDGIGVKRPFSYFDFLEPKGECKAATATAAATVCTMVSSPISTTVSETNSTKVSETISTTVSDTAAFITRVNKPDGPMEFAKCVDKQTGRGLRSYLLAMGKRYGIRRVECTHLSFHDFRQDPRTKKRKKDAMDIVYREEDGYKIEAYEVDLPTVHTNTETGRISEGHETWISFMISVPELILNYYYHAVPAALYSNKKLPESWVVFALPLTHCVQYGVVTETSYPKEPVYSAEPPLTDPSPSTLSKAKEKEHKRIDFDLSFSGVPIFEFSEKPKKFLEGWDIWCMNNGELSMEADTDEQNWNGGNLGQYLSISATNDPRYLHEEVGDDYWYHHYFTSLRDNVQDWKAIRNIMSEGKLRIVARWDESPTEFDDVLNTDVVMWEERNRLFVSDDPRIGDGLGLRLSASQKMRQPGGFGRSKEKKAKDKPASPLLLTACRRPRVEKSSAKKGGRNNADAKKIASVNAWMERR
ncbi:uncharacterized protein BP5553_01131 [Venustampulla echinocandica]|uniref:Uncharacterized protein n=1 Tax=Venustampulla echinocandica TaxID=2656787 RepID=A0A370U037_9HELO|nr:uncharacterized protein BP5553_01131 [Venustampulla echinocandica]RDL41152.1 hypothetical protein BP5553_01131 [Venustampulla echinocandica]